MSECPHAITTGGGNIIELTAAECPTRLGRKLIEAEQDADRLYENLKWLRSISFDNGELSGQLWPQGETRDQINEAIELHEARHHGKIKQDPRGTNKIYEGTAGGREK